MMLFWTSDRGRWSLRKVRISSWSSGMHFWGVIVCAGLFCTQSMAICYVPTHQRIHFWSRSPKLIHPALDREVDKHRGSAHEIARHSEYSRRSRQDDKHWNAPREGHANGRHI